MQTEITVSVGSFEKLQKLLGAFDENLNIVADELGVVYTIKNTDVKIVGSENSVKVAKAVIEKLIEILDAGETIDKSRLVYCIELAREGNTGDIAKIMSGVVAITSKGKPIKCKTLGQKTYVDAISKNTVCFGVGPAGTGKTYLAVAIAVTLYKSKAIEKIILTRPAVEAGEKLGFLPGDLQTKVDPYLRPLYDALAEMFGQETYLKLLEKGAIEIAPLAYMRGRTLNDSFIILDEAQNTTKEQMKMFLTRIGYGSKAVITGDLSQTDLPDGKISGLKHATGILKDIDGIGIVKLGAKDVVRNPLVMKIVQAYDKSEKKKD